MSQKDFKLKRKVADELELLGYAHSAHPLELYERNRCVDSSQLPQLIGKKVWLAGWLIAAKLIPARKGKKSPLDALSTATSGVDVATEGGFGQGSLGAHPSDKRAPGETASKEGVSEAAAPEDARSDYASSDDETSFHEGAPETGAHQDRVSPQGEVSPRGEEAEKATGHSPGGRKVRGEMMFLSLEDLTGAFEATLFPPAYRRFARLARGQGPFLLHGRVEDDQGALSLNIDHLEELSFKQ